MLAGVQMAETGSVRKVAVTDATVPMTLTCADRDVLLVKAAVTGCAARAAPSPLTITATAVIPASGIPTVTPFACPPQIVTSDVPGEVAVALAHGVQKNIPFAPAYVAVP